MPTVLECQGQSRIFQSVLESWKTHSNSIVLSWKPDRLLRVPEDEQPVLCDNDDVIEIVIVGVAIGCGPGVAFCP